jgi:hypothetical protein
MNLIYRCIFLCFLAFSSSWALAQNQNKRDTNSSRKIHIQVKPVIGNQPLTLLQNYYLDQIQDSVKIEKLRFYISNVSFSANGNAIKTQGQQYFLIDVEKPNSLQLSLEVETLEELAFIQFQIGVDSATQMEGAQGGDLDPMHGMYWSWRSGYINFKCEGTSLSCPGNNNEFLFHIGGFQAPYNTIQSVKLPIQSDSLMLELDLSLLLTKQNITQNYKVMSPNQKAMTMANQFSSLFRILP